MARREVKIFTNLSDDKSRKDVDDEEKKFKKMVARMQDSANERGGYLRGRGALDTEDLLYLREMEDAEQDAERARIQAERRAFAQFRAAAAAKTEAAALPVLGQSKERAKPNARLQSQLPLTTFAVQPKKAKAEHKAEPNENESTTGMGQPTSASNPQVGPSRRPDESTDSDQPGTTAAASQASTQPSVLLELASYESDEEDDGDERGEEGVAGNAQTRTQSKDH